MNEGQPIVLKDALDPRRARLAIKFPPKPERQNHFGGFFILCLTKQRGGQHIYLAMIQNNEFHSNITIADTLSANTELLSTVYKHRRVENLIKRKN